MRLALYRFQVLQRFLDCVDGIFASTMLSEYREGLIERILGAF
jgi:hypothetical protein